MADVPVRALRVTFTGELGWELYAPGEYGARSVDHALGRRAASTAWSPAATAPSRACGWRRATGCGAPTSRPETTPYEAGLGFCVKLDKPGGFEGREALRAVKAAGVTRRLRCLTLDDPRAGGARQRAGADRRRGGSGG